MDNEFHIASNLEREKMTQFLPTFTETFKTFKHKFSPSNGFDCYDLLMKINNTNCVAEIKCRYKHYFSGYYLEQQKYEALKAKYPDKKLLYICISITGVYVYDLDKIKFDSIKLSKELLPLTSCKESRLVMKWVYTLPIDKSNCKYYPLFLV